MPENIPEQSAEALKALAIDNLEGAVTLFSFAEYANYPAEFFQVLNALVMYLKKSAPTVKVEFGEPVIPLFLQMCAHTDPQSIFEYLNKHLTVFLAHHLAVVRAEKIQVDVTRDDFIESVIFTIVAPQMMPPFEDEI
jgi:hypothetical protein